MVYTFPKVIYGKTMKRVFTSIVIQSLAIGLFCMIGSTTLLAKEPLGFYYGGRFSDKLLQYETLVLGLQNFSPGDLRKLQTNNVRVIAYISIGETDVLISGDGKGPGGYASWYFDEDGDGKPDQNPNWGSYYVNAGNKKWHDYVLDKVIPSLPRQINGLFLDTVDTTEIYEETRDDMIDLIGEIRQRYPDYFIVQNRGFNLIKDTAKSVDAVLFEDFSTHYDFENRLYERWFGDDLLYTQDMAVLLNQVKRTHPLEIWSLDYRESKDRDLLAHTLTRAARFGFLASSTNIEITRLDMMNEGSIDDEINKELPAPFDITDVSVSDTLRDIIYTIKTRGEIDSRAMAVQIFVKTSSSENPLFRFDERFSADYLVEKGFLYGYAGDGGSLEWDRISKVPWQVKNNLWTVAIDMSFMKISQNQLVEAVVATEDQGWGDRDTTGVLRFVSKIKQYSTRDQAGSTAYVAGDAKELTVTVGLSSMKAEISTEKPITAYSYYGLFIDTDEVDKGYQRNNITASHLILNNKLYQYNGDSTNWRWTFVKDMAPKQNENTLTYIIGYAEIGFTKETAEIIGAFLEAGTDEIQTTQTLQILRNYPAIPPISY